MPNPSWIHIGKVAGPHGLEGRVKVVSFSQNPESLFLATLFDAQGVPFHAPVAWQPCDSSRGRAFLVTLEGINSRNQAEELKGRNLYIPRESLPQLSGDDFYHIDLMNLWAYSLEGDVLGQVAKVHNFGAQDILEIYDQANDKSYSVPFSYDAVPGVDLEASCVYINKMFVLPF